MIIIFLLVRFTECPSILVRTEIARVIPILAELSLKFQESVAFFKKSYVYIFNHKNNNHIASDNQVFQK
jgi:hypothetical protein